jgi:tetratricopeptide (TPR) repeat protein/predicted Ser/Thr protein kinase
MAPTPDRWQQIEALYHAALERGRGVLDGADPELRREVESLLAEAPTGLGLLDQPAAALLAQVATIELKSGARLGPYQIEALVGEGGMGKVYRARDTRLGRSVAIKTSNARFSERFEREARAVAALNHPHICHLYDVGPDYLVMEYIEGTPLKGPYPLDETLQYAEQICDALDAAHQKGIIHRDLKPGNILLAERGVKLLDFGIAQMEPGPEDPTYMPTAGVIGTPAYMAPEQLQGKRADARSDIYSFGCVLHEMLTGKRTGRAGSPEIGRLVAKCLENDPDLRYQHASDIRADLLRARVTTATGMAKRWKALVPAAAVVAALVAGIFYFPRALHGKPKLTDKDTIVLADFDNKTGDPVFDGTLRQGLAVQLEQSPFLSMVSDQDIQKWLGLMRRQPDTRVTPEVARGICERIGSTAVLDGSIVSLGSQYVLGLRATNCRTGDIIDEEQMQAARKEEVLNALSQIASKFRTRVGESLAMVEKHSTPLAEATTSSLEALKAFSGAMKVLYSRGDAAALPLLQRTVGIDPRFAMAHAYLGRVYSDIGEPELSAESTRRAWQLRDRASDAERFFISADYELDVTGNIEKARQTFELWAQTYPRVYDAPGLLSGQIYPILGEHEKAVEEAKKAIGMNRDVPFGYANLATAYQFLDRPAEAEAVYGEMSARKLEFPDGILQRFDLAFVKGDKGEMEEAAALARRTPGAEPGIARQEALVLAYYGRLQEARRKAQLGSDVARKADRPETAATIEADVAIWEAFFGNALESNRDTAAALALSRGRDVEYGAALALAVSGDSARAQTAAGDLDKRFPEDTAVQSSYLPVLRALLALKRGEPSRAVESLQVSVPYEMGVPPSWFSGAYGELYPIYVRGLAYLAAHEGAEAVTEFQKILDHRGLVANDPIGALAHLQLGRASVLAGDKAKAKAAYQDFLTLWVDADLDIPILRQAKTEYSRLQ